jgi:hypothetical protein
MSFHDEPGPRPAQAIKDSLKLVWNRRGGSLGAEFVADLSNGKQLVVKTIKWKRPGFSGRTDRGWAAFWATEAKPGQWNLEQEGAAYSRAVDAQLHIERVSGLHR